MQLLAITPIVVSPDELARRQARYDRLAPAGVSVRLENLADEGAPSALETEADVVASEQAMLRQVRRSDLHGVDAILPDCVLDPVVGGDDDLPVPVYGIGRLAAAFAAGLGGRFGAVARNDAIAAELDRKLASYRLQLDRPCVAMGLSVADIADDATWAAAVERVTGELGCDVVINACSAVEIRSAGGPLLVDPTAVALQMLAVLASPAVAPAVVPAAVSGAAR